MIEIWTLINSLNIALFVFISTGNTMVRPCGGHRLSAPSHSRLSTTTTTSTNRILGVHGETSPDVSYDSVSSGKGYSTSSSGKGKDSDSSMDDDEYDYDDDYYYYDDDYDVTTFPPTVDPTTSPPTKGDDGVVPTLPPTMDDCDDDNKNDDYGYDDDFPVTTPPVEEIVEPSGSNDESFLERICLVYEDFAVASNFLQPTGTTSLCEEFQKVVHLMCPNDYDVTKICAATREAAVGDSNDTTATMNTTIEIEDRTVMEVAIYGEYCFPKFGNLLLEMTEDGVGEQAQEDATAMGPQCENRCAAFVTDSGCCKVDCL